MATQPWPTRENEWALSNFSSQVVVVQMVEPVEWIQSDCLCPGTLLPIQPPKINALIFKGMMEDFKIGLCKFFGGNIKFRRFFGLRVHSKSRGYLRVGFFVAVYAFRRVQIEGRAQFMVVQKAQESIWIGEEGFVPGVTRPA